MTTRFTFYGHSDDCIEVEVANVESGKSLHSDEVGGYDRPVTFRLVGAHETMAVLAYYDCKHAGSWFFAPGIAEETSAESAEHAMPRWPFTLEPLPHHGYSMKLSIDAPDGTFIEVCEKHEQKVKRGTRQLWPAPESEAE